MLLVEGAVGSLVIYFPPFAHKTAQWNSIRGIAPALSTAVPTRADSAENSSTAVSFDAAIADGYRPFRVYCDAGIDGFGAALEQEQLDGSVGPIAYISALRSIPRGTRPRWMWKLAALCGL